MDVRRLTPEDLPACQAIAEEHGWEVGLERWKLLLEVGTGWGAFLPGVGLAGTASLFDYEGRVALVGMVLVRKDLGRGGIGRRVVEEVLAHAPSCTYLYATPMGRGLYEKLGFVATDALLKFAGHPRSDAVSVPEVARLAPLDESDFDRVVRFDGEVFGAPRAKLLERLGRESVRSLVARRGDAVVGCGFATRVGCHLVLGPVGAEDEAVGVQLLAALARGQSLPVRLDAPVGRQHVADWARQAGLAEDAPIPLMSLAGQALPGRRAGLMAIASRGVG